MHRRRDLCSITQDGSDLILHFCNLQLEPDRLGEPGKQLVFKQTQLERRFRSCGSTLQDNEAVPLRLENSGHDVLGPSRPLTCQLLGSGRALLHLDEDSDPLDSVSLTRPTTERETFYRNQPSSHEPGWAQLGFCTSSYLCTPHPNRNLHGGSRGTANRKPVRTCHPS